MTVRNVPIRKHGVNEVLKMFNAFGMTRKGRSHTDDEARRFIPQLDMIKTMWFLMESVRMVESKSLTMMAVSMAEAHDDMLEQA